MKKLINKFLRRSSSKKDKLYDEDDNDIEPPAKSDFETNVSVGNVDLNDNSKNFGARKGAKVGPIGMLDSSLPRICKVPSSEKVDILDSGSLPRICKVPSPEKVDIFIKKLKLCSVVYDFNDTTKDLKGKDIKKRDLVELVEFVCTAKLRFDEVIMQGVFSMVSANLFRPLRVSRQDVKRLSVNVYDVEDDEPVLDPSWTHLQIVYEFLLKILSSSEMDPKVAKSFVDDTFVLRLLELFDSEDRRERKHLMNTLHRIYVKFVMHRPLIRKAINNILYQFIYETEKHNGVAELLVILGSIISGFDFPLKEEHKVLLICQLIPLHKPKCLSMYHKQLSHCILQFLEKDFKLVDVVVLGLLKYWPKTNSSKQVLFLSELEGVLEVAHNTQFQRFMVPLFHQIGRCVSSSHFQVAESALLLWKNDHVRNLVTQNRRVLLPIVLPYLERVNHTYWNRSVMLLTLTVKKILFVADKKFFEECMVRVQEDEIKAAAARETQAFKWKQLEDLATSKAVSEEAVAVSSIASSPVTASSNA